jgi:soluble lytic murein transglycosylase-like protein
MAKKMKQAKAKPKPKARPAAKPAAKSTAKLGAKSAATKSAPAKAGPRKSWLDAGKHKPMIDQYARQLNSFIKAMTDGWIEESELAEQEARLVAMMKEIEPQLDPAVHERVTQLLCELTAYDIMQMLHTMQQARPKTVFRG